MLKTHMKISPGRVQKAAEGLAIPCYRKTDVRRQNSEVRIM
jgi:hypothetical protein